ncbi:anti-sigma factor family protein [Candidatus Latescibacterota bacterium]
MNCEHAENLMLDFLYGEISDEQAKEFLQHLNMCDKCSGCLRDLKNLRNLIQKIPKITDSSITYKSPHWVRKTERRHRRWYAPIAAALVLIVLSIFVVLNTSFQYERGTITLRFGNVKQASLSEYPASIPDYKISGEELDMILQYINYLENKQNAERIILTGQLENFANTTLREFRRRDEMLEWLVTNYAVMSEQPTSSQER